MRATQTKHVFTMDSDGLMVENITALVHNNWEHFRTHDIWFVWMPPRSSWPFSLLTLRAMNDITQFWNAVFDPSKDIWPDDMVGGTSPNDMIAVGTYTHSALGGKPPFPCWGVGLNKPVSFSFPP